MNAQAWLLDPKVRQAVHADDVCRHLVDSIHDAMEAGSITAADLGRHLKMTEAEVRLGISPAPPRTRRSRRARPWPPRCRRS